MSKAKLYNIGYISSNLVSGSNLSDLEIDTNKDWNAKSISNLSSLSGPNKFNIKGVSDYGIEISGNTGIDTLIKFGVVNSSPSPLLLELGDFSSPEDGRGVRILGNFILYNESQVPYFQWNYGGSRFLIGPYSWGDDPEYLFNILGSTYSQSISSQAISGGALRTSYIYGNQISGLAAPVNPSSAVNKKYVDDREINIEGQIAAINLCNLANVDDSLTEVDNNVLTWLDDQWTSQPPKGGVTYISSCTDGLNITGWTSGQVLTWIGETSKWVNKYPALTFNVANVRVSANSYLELANFTTNGGKSSYLLQASVCASGGYTLSGLKIVFYDDSILKYSTSSSHMEQFGPLAKTNANSLTTIRFMYSGTHGPTETGAVLGYKYGSAVAQVVVY
jgi:hypothetical protein